MILGKLVLLGTKKKCRLVNETKITSTFYNRDGLLVFFKHTSLNLR